MYIYILVLNYNICRNMNYNNKYQLVGISQNFYICAPLEKIALLGKKNGPETPLSKYFMVLKKEVFKL